MSTVRLFSPIPPMKTGTAFYFDYVLGQISPFLIDKSEISVVIDGDFLPTGRAPSEICGFRIEDYRAVTNVVKADETRVFFVANNEFHSYIHHSITCARACAGGRIITVIHDPCIFMIMNKLAGDGTYGFSRDQLIQAIQPQYGNRSEKMLSDLYAGNLPNIFDYITHGQAAAIRQSNEVWTHSVYGALKIALETDQSIQRCPPIRVVRHPEFRAPERDDAATDFRGADKVRFGVFGWVTPSKRVAEIFRGFALALDRMSSDDRARVELVVVGQLPDPAHYDVWGVASAYNLTEHIRFFDYVSNSEFTRLINSCSLIFNLRYPSCGETSGALAHAAGAGTGVLASRYQAFAGERGVSHDVTILPHWEEWVIASEICEALERLSTAKDRQDGQGNSPTVPSAREIRSRNGSYQACEVAKLLSLRIWERLGTSNPPPPPFPRPLLGGSDRLRMAGGERT